MHDGGNQHRSQGNLLGGSDDRSVDVMINEDSAVKLARGEQIQNYEAGK